VRAVEALVAYLEIRGARWSTGVSGFFVIFPSLVLVLLLAPDLASETLIRSIEKVGERCENAETGIWLSEALATNSSRTVVINTGRSFQLAQMEFLKKYRRDVIPSEKAMFEGITLS
jgi:hypothetical protein